MPRLARSMLFAILAVLAPALASAAPARQPAALTLAPRFVRTTIASDLDADGRADQVAIQGAARRQLVISLAGRPEATFDIDAEASGAILVQLADIDADGDTDVVAWTPGDPRGCTILRQENGVFVRDDPARPGFGAASDVGPEPLLTLMVPEQPAGQVAVTARHGAAPATAALFAVLRVDVPALGLRAASRSRAPPRVA